MGIKFWEVVCDEHDISGGGNCGNCDAQLDHIDVFYHEASGGKNVPHGVLMNLKPGVIDAAASSARETS